MDLVEVEALAAKLATTLVPPRVIALSGDLGAGKTTFARAFVRALPYGDKARIKSPTFAIHHEYATQPVCHHLDLYRLRNADELDDLGLRDLLDNPLGFVLIEWPEVASAKLPKNTIHIRFAEISPTERNVEILDDHR
jgi:tRNA threonylcarbamoyl adenosine modification protein YjeE